jgi:tetratricopeptide (TPR) repeat protein
LAIFRRLNVSPTNDAVAGETLFRLTGIPGALGRSDSEISNLAGEAALFALSRRIYSSVSFNLRIGTPGRYHLFIRCDGHDAASDSLRAQIKELKDGFGGPNVDFYLFETPNRPDADFATMPWQGEAHPETDFASTAIPSEWAIAKPGDYTLEFNNREDGAAVDTFVLQLTNLPTPAADGPPESESTTNHIFLERGGRVVVEAEHFASRMAGQNNSRWLIVPTETRGDVEHLHYRGTGYIQFLPDSSPDKYAPLLLNRALARRFEGDYVTAESLIRQALGKQTTLSGNEQLEATIALGDVCDRMGDAAAARSQYLKALELEATNDAALYQRALLHLAVGDMNGYRTMTKRIAAQLQTTVPGPNVHLLHWACVLAPDAVTNYSPVLEAVRRTVARQTNSSDSLPDLQTLGALLYRARHYPEAVLQLTDVFQISQRIDINAILASPIYGIYFLAMAHAQLNHTNEAEEWFQRASDLDPLARAGETNAVPGIAWNRRLTLQLLRKEADSVLHAPPPSR